MTVLTTNARKALPKSVFALPEKEAYPIEDLRHAANAKARAKQELDAGKLSQPDYDRVIAKANAFQRLHGALKKKQR